MKRLITAFFLVLAVGLTVVTFGGDITPNGMYQGDLYTFLSNLVTFNNESKADYNLLRLRELNHPLDYMTFNIGATATVYFDIGVSSYGAASYPAYMINGIMYEFTGTTTKELSAVATAITAQATNTDCLYLIQADSSGNIYCIQGTAVAAGAGTEVWPTASASLCTVGGIKLGLGTAATGTFTVGTTQWGTVTNATVTTYQLFYPPSGNSAPTTIAASDLTLTGL